MQHSIILGIESSCDDTAAAVWQDGKILANLSISQAIHENYGGVVPELASRAHQSNIVPVVSEALKKANVDMSEVDAIAVTIGPGLMGSLLVGVNFAKGMALTLKKPLLAVNHLQAHIAALYIQNPKPQFPFMCLLVSGGHTQLMLVHDYLEMEIVGATIDDAAGEAFDKAAKLLNLPYPGGPQIQKMGASGDPDKYRFPKPQTPDLTFSFSGIKTSLLYFLRDQSKENAQFISEELPNICAGFQASVVDYLIYKTEKALKRYPVKGLALCGGVSANKPLRQKIEELAQKRNLECMIPDFEYCTDNAAMIATAGHYLLEKGEISGLEVVPFSRG